MAAMIAAANVIPNFLLRRSIHASDLLRLQDPAVIREYSSFDENGEPYFAYTVAGFLDGENIAGMMGGATVGGDVIVISAPDQATADYMAGLGLEDTINALAREDEQVIDALAAKARLQSLNPIARLDLSMASDANRSEAFEADIAKIRPLVGDDIILASGH